MGSDYKKQAQELADKIVKAIAADIANDKTGAFFTIQDVGRSLVVPHLEAFASQSADDARKEEREACAKVCEIIGLGICGRAGVVAEPDALVAFECEKAIRNRSTQENEG